MDLSKCKLISWSRSKLTDKSTDFKYWQSSAFDITPIPKACESVYQRMRKLTASKSVPRLNQMFRDKSSVHGASNANLEPDLQNILPKIPRQSPSPETVEMRKRMNNYYINIPEVYTGESSRIGVKPMKLVPIKKKVEEALPAKYEWSPPMFRDGVNGSKFTSKREKTMFRKRNRGKREMKSQINDEEDSDRVELSAVYKELYIQKILEKKALDFNNVFKNPTDIAY